ncbi:ABC transporter permease [Frankia sp. AiPs1]|uniref:ABC transporter permease n=1 Tax=Frankia sp. AiPs1 TaxID=573493 RepID=UPI00204338A8|nr:ABC transporter permease [Frankia sp. AiPs1]MCM3923305.1 ABC transporter permease [Frankia sp. AiPs1]
MTSPGDASLPWAAPAQRAVTGWRLALRSRNRSRGGSPGAPESLVAGPDRGLDRDPDRTPRLRVTGRTARRETRRRAPWALWVPGAVAALFLLLPLVGLLVRAPWSGLPDLITEHSVREALLLSLETATAATVLSLVFGIPLAWLLARTRFPGRSLLRALVTLPLVLPPVVGGVALLLALGRRGIVGQHLDDWFGITLPFTTAGVVIAQTFVAMPFLVVSVEGALNSADRRFEDAAATLGAGPWTTFRRVTVPLVAPAVAAGAALCWARALGEFGATITFAGNFPGTTTTMPLAVYLALETDADAAIALSLVLLAVCVAVLLALRARWFPGARRLLRSRSSRPTPVTVGPEGGLG